MNLINKILTSIILICVGGIFYVSYNFIKIMEHADMSNPARAIKEMMLFFVYIILFGLVISTTAKLLIKLRKYSQDEKRVPRPLNSGSFKKFEGTHSN